MLNKTGVAGMDESIFSKQPALGDDAEDYILRSCSWGYVRPLVVSLSDEHARDASPEQSLVSLVVGEMFERSKGEGVGGGGDTRR